jgi:serine-type D-Ala-D-Ala carboxypeptidase (penicillin-binding protein 5/6)
MKRNFYIHCLSLFIISILFLFFFPGAVYPDIHTPAPYSSFNDQVLLTDGGTAIYDDHIDIESSNAILMEAESGSILWEKNSSEPVYPASITKIMTGILAIENIKDLNQIIEISGNAAGANHSAFYFNEGDRITLIDLLKAALIASHNNATIALAEYISGNDGDFVDLMNLKAREIGAYNTNFENTNGLDSDFPGHKTTAYDLALIAKYAMENELFRDIVSRPEDTIKLNDEKIRLYNTNKLLAYDYIKGIKTGYTGNAGFCLAAFSDLNDMELITVILNSSTYSRDKDALSLIYWVDNNIKKVKLVDSGTPMETIEMGSDTRVKIDLFAAEDITRMIHLTNNHVEVKHSFETIGALPIEKNMEFGLVTVAVNDQNIASTSLVSRSSVDQPLIYQEISGDRRRQKIIIMASILAFYFLIIIFIIIKNLQITKMKY